MRYGVLILFLLVSLPASSLNAAVPQVASKPQGTLIRSIVIEGFVLGDRTQFVKLFKPYRNKYLTTTDMDVILHKIQGIYEMDGYQQMVLITYKVNKHRLVFTSSMTS